MTEVTTLGALAAQGRLAFNDGYRTKRSELGEPGIPILRVAEVQDGSIAPTYGDHVREAYRGAIGPKVSRPGDVIVTTKGTVGRVVQMTEEMDEFVYSPQLCYFRIAPRTGITARFLYYWFRGPQFREQAAGVQSQTDMAAYINLADMSTLTISVPPIAEQEGIADTLGALDDKINANERSAGLLAKLIQALFDFHCRPLPSSASLTKMAEITKGVSYRSVDLAPSSTAMVTLKSVSRGGGYKRDGLKGYVGAYKPSQVVRNGDLAVAQTDLTQGAEVVGRVIRVPRIEGYETLVASLDLLIVRPRPEVTLEYLYGVLMQESFRQHCRRHTSGTTVLHLASDALARYQVPTVPSGGQQAFSRAIRPLLEASDQLQYQDTTLRAIRDALLPGLLSGRLRASTRSSQAQVIS